MIYFNNYNEYVTAEVHHHGDHHHSSHRHVDTLSAELSDNTFDSEDGGNVNPRGAILSLTMGTPNSSSLSIKLAQPFILIILIVYS